MLKGQIQDVLSTQWDNDSKHGKRKINYLKERLFKNLNKLVFQLCSYLFKKYTILFQTFAYYYQYQFKVIYSNATLKVSILYIIFVIRLATASQPHGAKNERVQTAVRLAKFT